MSDTFEKAASRYRTQKLRRQFVPYTERLGPVSLPVDATDPELYPNIAAACEHYASLPEETRAEREAEWEGK